MIAMMVTKGTNMIAMIMTMGTQYDCNLSSESDHIWLQSLSKGAKYDCNVGNHRGITSLWFLDRPREKKFSMIAVIFGPFWKTLKSCMVRLGIEIAFILGPHFDHRCNHIWSSLLERLQSYVVHPYIYYINGIWK